MAVGRLFIRENFRQHSKEMVRTIQSCSNWEPMFFYGVMKLRVRKSKSTHELSKILHGMCPVHK